MLTVDSIDKSLGFETVKFILGSHLRYKQDLVS